jgi:hypothetical protein
MFQAWQPVLLFDYFRVPYDAVDPSKTLSHLPPGHPLGRCSVVQVETGDGRIGNVYWPRADALAADAGEFRLGSVPIFARVLSDAVIEEWLRGGGWERTTPILDAAGNRVASLWRDAESGFFIPFDPAEVIRNYWSEEYLKVARSSAAAPLKRFAKRSYYVLRPAIPRPAQIHLRRLLSKLQMRTRFPRWPVETALHDFYDLHFRWLTELAGRPIPRLAAWPGGRSWALVLTHDVETDLGYRNLHLLRERERAAGYRSSWNFVPKRYSVEDRVVQELQADGFEVGVHGLYHDGKDLASLPVLQERIPAMREHAERWQALGFRSPATHRRWEWMPLLGFEYDSSYPDTDPFEPDAGGCLSWLPYFNENLVELPITLPQDHTLFAILRHEDERMWLQKTSLLRSRDGMALLLTHPDYMLEETLLDAYTRYLETFADDATVWRALPREAADWWRRRAASRLVPRNGEWEIEGPAAADGRVEFVESDRLSAS